VVTLGADGAIVVDESGVTSVHALAVKPVDATGAGDAFNGILAAELAAGTDLRGAVQRAVAGASLSTLAGGAQAGLPTRDEVIAGLEG
jgi:ribokinase